jgi:hypothetical protein
MESIPGYAEPFPPPPPAQRSRKGLWIGLGIGAVVLCLCCIVIAIAAYLNWTRITNFLYTQTAQFYSNPDAGISLYYPQGWQYEEWNDDPYYEVILASSAEILDSSYGIPQTGAEMIVATDYSTTSDFEFNVDASSMVDVVDSIAKDEIYDDTIRGQNLHTFKLSGYPAASGLYVGIIDSDTTSDPSAVYIIAVLRGEEIMLVAGVCPETEWSQYHSIFNSIINSMSIVTP